MIDNFFDRDIRIPDMKIDLSIKPEKKIERILQDSDLPQNKFFCHFITDQKQEQKQDQKQDRGYLLPQFRDFS